MNWLQKVSQIPASDIKGQTLWFHGTDNFTAYSLVENILKPRSETGNSSYQGSLSSIPSAVYLTNNVGKAAKHAIDRCEQTKGHPVILVIEPTDLGMVHIDEDFVHMMLQGQTYFGEGDWYPSPMLEKEIFEMADESTRATDYFPKLSTKNAVIQFFKTKEDNWGDDVENEYLAEEGVVPNEHGEYEYDESMHLAKYIATALDNKHQQESIMNFQSMAHQGQVRAREIYLIPFQINTAKEPGETYMQYATAMRSYADLQQYGQRIDPKQLMMEFMR